RMKGFFSQLCRRIERHKKRLIGRRSKRLRAGVWEQYLCHSLRERLCICKLRLDDHPAVVVDVAKFLVDFYNSQAFGKFFTQIESWLDNDLSSPIDEAPFGTDFNCGKPFGKISGLLEWQAYHYLPSFINIAELTVQIASLARNPTDRESLMKVHGC